MAVVNRKRLMNENIKDICVKCGEEKEICCTVDGEPWCEDCFGKALG